MCWRSEHGCWTSHIQRQRIRYVSRRRTHTTPRARGRCTVRIRGHNWIRCSSRLSPRRWAPKINWPHWRHSNCDTSLRPRWPNWWAFPKNSHFPMRRRIANGIAFSATALMWRWLANWWNCYAQNKPHGTFWRMKCIFSTSDKRRASPLHRRSFCTKLASARSQRRARLRHPIRIWVGTRHFIGQIWFICFIESSDPEHLLPSALSSDTPSEDSMIYDKWTK